MFVFISFISASTLCKKYQITPNAPARINRNNQVSNSVIVSSIYRERAA
ncbi:MAG: hypothetical protein WCL00_00180 [Bacteroidota bacterium]